MRSTASRLTKRLAVGLRTTIGWPGEGEMEMRSKRITALLATAALLALLWAAGSAIASPPREGPGGEGGVGIAATVAESISYQGRLTDPNTGDPLDGTYIMRFQLYDAETGGTMLWDSGPQSVDVEDGLFNVELDVDQDDFDGQELWLRIRVGGEWLTPRREILPVPYALSLRPGANIEGSSSASVLYVKNNGAGSGIYGVTESTSDQGHGVRGLATASTGQASGVCGIAGSTSGRGVYGSAGAPTGNTIGVLGDVASPDGHGVHGRAPVYGVYGEAYRTSDFAYGVYGESASTSGRGVYGRATATSGNTVGVKGVSDSEAGKGVVGIASATSGETRGVHGKAHSPDGYGVYGEAPVYGVRGEATRTSGSAIGVFGVTNSSSGYGVHAFASATSGNTRGVSGIVQSPGGIAGYFKCQGEEGMGLRVESPGTLIEAWDGVPLNRRFYINNAGHVFADGSFHPGGADLAEMLPAVEGLEPGDVLVIGPDGKLARSSEAYNTAVAGVYSTNPGFVGGSDEDGVNPGKVPLAVVGVTPVKVSAENGPIAPGDLLTTSATPGHAMKATEPKLGTILGKALGELQSGTGVIDALVILQ